jgi:hypothetical protein
MNVLLELAVDSSRGGGCGWRLYDNGNDNMRASGKKKLCFKITYVKKQTIRNKEGKANTKLCSLVFETATNEHLHTLLHPNIIITKWTEII